MGERPVARALEGCVSRWEVRGALRLWKARDRARDRRRHAEQRVSIRVRCRDAVWAQDATHLGRDPAGRAVQAEVLREVASTRTLALSVGPAATAKEIVALLERAVQARGCAPLVWLTDNAAVYGAPEVSAWCLAEGVLHLRTLPRTPQHNAHCEHGNGELKQEARLGKGVRIACLLEALGLLVDARRRLDNHRLRVTRGWRTAIEADRDAQHWSEKVDRERFREEVACAFEQTVLDCPNSRARRRAEREAVLHVLENHELLVRTRAGVRAAAAIEDIET